MSSSSEATSESSEEEIVAKPVFIRPKRLHNPADSIKSQQSSLKDRSIDRIEKLLALQSSTDSSLRNHYDGIDDTDDIDPEAEYLAWQKRSEERIKREKQRSAALEQEKNERYRQSTHLSPSSSLPTTNGGGDPATSNAAKLGAFFTADEKFSLRTQDKLQDSEDHSRPTRFKPGGKLKPTKLT